MAKKKTKPRATRLLKKQKPVVDKLLNEIPHSRIRSIRDDSCNYRTVILEWTIHQECEPIEGCSCPGFMSITYQRSLELTPSGKVRREEETITHIVYPHCFLEGRRHQSASEKQMALPLRQMLELPAPKAAKIRQHLYKTRKNRTAAKPKKASSIQQTLPLTGYLAELHSIRTQKGHQPESSESLMAERVSHWSLEQRREVVLPEALVELLKAANATSDEWNNCIDLYGVIGLPGCLNYIQGLEYLRRSSGAAMLTHFGTQPVIQSEPVPNKKTINPVQKQTTSN